MPGKNQDTHERFTRLANPFLKKIETNGFAKAQHFVYFNFSKIHKSLSVTPEIQAGLNKSVMKIEDIAIMADIKAPTKIVSYKKTEKN